MKAKDYLINEKKADAYTAMTKEEMPFTRGFFIMPYKNSQSVTEFYDKLDEQTMLEGDYKLTKKKPEKFNPTLLKRLKEANKNISKLNKAERELLLNNNIDIDARKRKQQQIQKQRIMYAKRALGK